MRPATLARLGEFGFESYDAYLASNLWRANKTRLNLPRQCQICGTRRDLHAHHCSYENVCNEQLGDLIVLCDEHHKAVHKLVRSGVPLIEAHTRNLSPLKSKSSKKKATKRNKKKPKMNTIATRVKPLRSESDTILHHEAKIRARKIRREERFAFQKEENDRKNARRLASHYSTSVPMLAGLDPAPMTQLERDIIAQVVRTGQLD
jgi:hypothetical protein